jgi:hypothetical protein
MALRMRPFLCSLNFILRLGACDELHGVGTMAHFWLCYRDSEQRFNVIIIEGPSLIHARMKAALAGLDVGLTFTEGHALGVDMEALMPPAQTGRRLADEAAKPTDWFEGRSRKAPVPPKPKMR